MTGLDVPLDGYHFALEYEFLGSAFSCAFNPWLGCDIDPRSSVAERAARERHSWKKSMVFEINIADFWQTHPCGEQLVERLHGDYLDFFARYDAFRYRLEHHIPKCLDDLSLGGKRVLEIGLGQGADSEQIIRRGGIWTGLDLTAEACQRVSIRLNLKSLPFQAIVQGSALELPFTNESFDLVFSHGVLHHIPDVRRASQEIARVLKPSGELVAMLYARHSLNYWIAIAVVRRLGLAGMYLSGHSPSAPIYRRHLELARRLGMWHYLSMREFIHRSTDGPENPYSQVYDLRRVRRDFPDFAVTRSYKRFMHAPPLPVRRLPLARVLGWHLWVHLKKRYSSSLQTATYSRALVEKQGDGARNSAAVPNSDRFGMLMTDCNQLEPGRQGSDVQLRWDLSRRIADQSRECPQW